MSTYDVILYIHIIAGTIALAAYWTAAALRKGSSAHRIVGRTYLITMSVIAITGVLIAIFAYQRGRSVFGSFLLYLVIIVVTPTWLGWRAMRDKRDVKRYTGPLYHAFAWINIAAGVAMVALGIAFRNLLFGGLSAVGLLTGFFMLRFARTEATDRRWYVRRHYIAMLGSGVGTHVAFLNLGLARLLPEAWGTLSLRIAFVVPFVALLFARLWLDRTYGAAAAGTSV